MKTLVRWILRIILSASLYPLTTKKQELTPLHNDRHTANG